ncbi:MAG TPA: hypothetical protein VFR12_12990, partial [Pyrinomonadaceae bacterium]|nr:hypothetical protein [Pyrinomonadaceae bacterium]
MSPLRIVIAVVVAVCATLAVSRALLGGARTTEPPRSLPTTPAEQDERLQTTATAALGQREGAIVVIDPQTGRIRA